VLRTRRQSRDGDERRLGDLGRRRRTTGRDRNGAHRHLLAATAHEDTDREDEAGPDDGDVDERVQLHGDALEAKR
jgi:hypothetical protein